MASVKSLLKVTVGDMLKQAAAEKQVSRKGLRRDAKKNKQARLAILNRWRRLIRGALSGEGLAAFGDAARAIRRRFTCTQKWRQIVKALINKDTNQEFGVAIKMMHVGFFKSFTIPATTYFRMYHDRKSHYKRRIVVRWSRLTAKAMEANGIAS